MILLLGLRESLLRLEQHADHRGGANRLGVASQDVLERRLRFLQTVLARVEGAEQAVGLKAIRVDLDRLAKVCLDLVQVPRRRRWLARRESAVPRSAAPA